MKKIFIFWLSYCLLLLALLGLNTPTAMAQLTNWENFTNGDMVTKIIADGDYLWIATGGGLVKMNRHTEEKEFYNRASAGLPDNHLLALHKDAQGNLWMGGRYYGVGKFDGMGCEVYDEGNSGLFSGQYCMAITTGEDGTVYIGGLFALNVFDGESWESYSTPNMPIDMMWGIYDMKMDEDGVLWLGAETTASQFFFGRFAGGEIEIIPEIQTVVSSLEIDGEGSKWLGTRSGGLIKYDSNGQITKYNTSNSNIPSNTIYYVKQSPSGDLWLSTGGGMLAKFDGADFVRYDPGIIYPGRNLIHCFEFDDDGTLWIGSKYEGLIKFDGESYTRIDVSSSPLRPVIFPRGMEIDSEGSLWFGTNTNLTQIDKDDRWEAFYEIDDVTTLDFRVRDIVRDFSGNQWLGFGMSDTCLLKNTPVDKEVIKWSEMPIDSWLNDIFCFDRKGNLWLGTTGAGIFKYDGNGWEQFTTMNSPLKSNIVLSLIVDENDNLWGGVGETDAEMKLGCLFKYNGTTWTIYTPHNSGLPTHVPAKLAFDSKGYLWINCWDFRAEPNPHDSGGLTKFDGTTWETYNMSNSGIPSNAMHSLAIDKNDHLWLGTFDRYVGPTHFDGESGWTTYNVRNSGIAYNVVNDMAFDYDKNLIWFGHLQSSGLSRASYDFSLGSGIGGIEPGRKVDIYPNPVADYLSINSKEAMTTLTVYDLSGRVHHSYPLNSTDTSIDMSSYAPGIYLLSIEFASGAKERMKIIKK